MLMYIKMWLLVVHACSACLHFRKMTEIIHAFQRHSSNVCIHKIVQELVSVSVFRHKRTLLVGFEYLYIMVMVCGWKLRGNPKLSGDHVFSVLVIVTYIVYGCEICNLYIHRVRTYVL